MAKARREAENYGQESEVCNKKGKTERNVMKGEGE